MPRHFIELAVRARRFVTRAPNRSQPPDGPRLTARRQVGGELTQFSFRLALVIDLAYVGIGALGGAAVGRATGTGVLVDPASASCRADSAADNTRQPALTDITPPLIR